MNCCPLARPRSAGGKRVPGEGHLEQRSRRCAAAPEASTSAVQTLRALCEGMRGCGGREAGGGF